VLNNKIENYEAVEGAIELIETPVYLTSFKNKALERHFLFT